MPFLCNWLRTVTSKIVKFTKLFKDSLVIKFKSYWIPFNTALAAIAMAAKAYTMLPSLTHDISGSYSRARTKFVVVHLESLRVINNHVTDKQPQHCQAILALNQITHGRQQVQSTYCISNRFTVTTKPFKKFIFHSSTPKCSLI